MMNANANAALQHYRQVGAQQALSASPHRLIQMLMAGALEKIRAARFFMERGEIAPKGEQVSWAISIIDGLRDSLDMEGGGDIATNLDNLYEYMSYRLVVANAKNDREILDEVAGLLEQVKSAWDAISDEVGKDS